MLFVLYTTFDNELYIDFNEIKTSVPLIRIVSESITYPIFVPFFF